MAPGTCVPPVSPLLLGLALTNMSGGLFGSGVCGEWDNQRDNWQGPPSLQLEAREASGCVHSIHDGELYMGEFGKPSLLVVVDMVSDGLVDSFVCPFAATISFGAVGHGHLQFEASELVEGCPKFSSKERTVRPSGVESHPVFQPLR